MLWATLGRIQGMAGEREDYVSYLLRMWRVSEEGEPVWRASLHSPETGQRRGFAGLTDLFTFLEKEVGLGGPCPEARGEAGKGGDAHT